MKNQQKKSIDALVNAATLSNNELANVLGGDGSTPITCCGYLSHAPRVPHADAYGIWLSPPVVVYSGC